MDKDLLYSILIVDDSINDLDVLSNILKTEYTIYFAKTGREAIARADKIKPDLILLDIILPGLNGFDVLSELKKSETTCDIPVIFITGLNGVEDEEKGFCRGAVDYITKPFHASIVKARIKSHLNTAERMKSQDNASLMIKTRQETRNIFFRDLIYINVTGHWLNFNLADGETVTVYASLKEYEDMLLADSRFAHCHKSFIINMDYVKAVEVRDVSMKNDILIPISKKYMDIKKRYIEWIT